MPHRNRESNFEDYSSYRGDGFIHVGRYKFNMKDKIGHGSYATVYKGSVKTKSGKPLIVAIKEMDIALTPLKEMKKEVRILKKVQHENIVKFIFYEFSVPFVYIVTEFCNAGDLCCFLYVRGGADPSILRTLLKQVGSGIKFLHSIQSIHRDIKPSNILLNVPSVNVRYDELTNEDITFKIADFGLARMLKRSQRATTWCGTPAYMAPEIILQPTYDERVDIWSLGVIAYECVMGELPFQAETQDEYLEIYDAPINLTFCRSADRHAKDVIARMLKKSPEDRISIDEVLEHATLCRPTKREKLRLFFRRMWRQPMS